MLCGDALELMRAMPAGSVNLVITSPPYNLKNSTGNGMKDGRGGKWERAALK
ncbi:MAG: site-specific DNA-methyltransferase, partial [Alphaproteobacteria bacterium]|nr:site-specific DNA-methyltransferase [Alphaproteobacteria bacterium]